MDRLGPGLTPTRPRERERLGRILLRMGLVTPEALGKATQAIVLRGGRLGAVLYEQGAISLQNLTRGLAEWGGVAPAGADRFFCIPPDVVATVPASTAIAHHIVPLRRVGGAIEVAMMDALDPQALSAIRDLFGSTASICVAPEILIFYALRSYYGFSDIPRFYVALCDELADQPGGVEKAVHHKSISTEVRRGARAQYDVNEDAKTGEVLAPPPAASKPQSEQLARLGSRFERVRTRYDLADLLIAIACERMECAVLFMRVSDLFVGWLGAGTVLSAEELETMLIPAQAETILAQAARHGRFVGSVPQTSANSLLLASIGRTPTHCAVLPVYRSALADIFLYVDGAALSAADVISDLQSHCYAAGEKLESIIEQQKALDRTDAKR